MESAEQGNAVPDRTRLTTPGERENIAGIELDPTEVDHFMDLVRKGLVEAASAHDAAVQDNFGLRAEVAVRLTRSVADADGSVSEIVGDEVVGGHVGARKVYKNPDQRPLA